MKITKRQLKGLIKEVIEESKLIQESSDNELYISILDLLDVSDSDNIDDGVNWLSNFLIQIGVRPEDFDINTDGNKTVELVLRNEDVDDITDLINAEGIGVNEVYIPPME